MDFTCEERPSESPFVQRIWRSRSASCAVSFISMAETHCGIVVAKTMDRTIVRIRSPQARATFATSPPNVEFLGITFKFGVFMTNLPPRMIMDGRDLNLPGSIAKSFWVAGCALQYPEYHNAETFVDRLVRRGLLAFDPVVDAVLKEQPLKLSPRTVQRRFLQATGLTYSVARQIVRARHAVALLKHGVSIIDAVHEAGYYDQAHLTRSLKYFIGVTPAQIMDTRRSVPLSFLYKTAR